MELKDFGIRAIFMLPVYAVIAYLLHGLIAANPPVEMTYVHPHFTAVPVQSREQAESYAIREVKPGQTVYRWVEYCVFDSTEGEVAVRWVGNNYGYSAPLVPTFSVVGCPIRRSIAITVPEDAPAGELMQVVTLRYSRPMLPQHIVKQKPITAQVVR